MAIQGVRLASSNYLATAASQYFQPGRTLTIMCWARPGTLPPTSNYYTLLGTTTSAGVSGWGMSIQGGAGGTAFWEMFFTNNGSAYDDFRFTNGVATGRWDHIAWVMRSDATEAGYLNGVQETLVQSANAGVYPAAASRTLQIKWGDATGNGSFDGAMAYVRIFDGELSGAEIRAEMFARRACNKRLHVIADFPLEMPGGTSSIVAPDIGPQGLPVTSVTGTVTWDRDPPLPKHITPLARQIRILSVPPAGGGGQSALLATATETDSGQTLGRLKTRAVPLASTTDSAIAETRRKSRALAIAGTTDTAPTTLGRAKARTLAIGTETDTGQTLTRSKRRTLAIAGTTDSGITLGRLKRRALAIGTETDTGQTLARTHARLLVVATETDSAPVAFGRRKLRLIEIANQANEALGVTNGQARQLSTALTTDTAIGLTRSHARLLAAALETDLARGVARLLRLGIALEVDSAILVTHPELVSTLSVVRIDVIVGPQGVRHVWGPQEAIVVAGPQTANAIVD